MLKNIKNGFSSVDLRTLATLIPNVIFVGMYSALIYYIEYDVLKFDFQTYFHCIFFTWRCLRAFVSVPHQYRLRALVGRTPHLGSLVDASRNMAIKLHVYLPEVDKESRTYFATMIPNYFFAMKEHLRDGVKFEELEEPVPGVFEDLKKHSHIPNRISNLLFTKINRMAADKIITQEQFLTLDKLSDVFTQAVGGCERIKNTPIPESYSKHLDRFVLFYTLLLPFGFMHDLKWWSVPTIMIIYFALEGIKTIGEEIEDPFGKDANDLPTDVISERTKGNIREILLQP